MAMNNTYSYVRVRNWHKYQHYSSAPTSVNPKKRRQLAWVKYYIDELEDEEFLSLPYAAQLLFHRLLLLEAKAVNRGERGVLKNFEAIAKRTRMESDDVAKMLPLLVKGRWLSESKTTRCASKMLARAGACGRR